MTPHPDWDAYAKQQQRLINKELNPVERANLVAALSTAWHTWGKDATTAAARQATVRRLQRLLQKERDASGTDDAQLQRDERDVARYLREQKIRKVLEDPAFQAWKKSHRT